MTGVASLLIARARNHGYCDRQAKGNKGRINQRIGSGLRNHTLAGGVLRNLFALLPTSCESRVFLRRWVIVNGLESIGEIAHTTKNPAFYYSSADSESPTQGPPLPQAGIVARIYHRVSTHTAQRQYVGGCRQGLRWKQRQRDQATAYMPCSRVLVALFSWVWSW